MFAPLSLPRPFILSLFSFGLVAFAPLLSHAQEGAEALDNPAPDSFAAPLSPAESDVEHEDSTVAEVEAVEVLEETEEAEEAEEVEEPSEPSPFHLGVDLSWQSLRIRYITPVAIAAPDCACGMEDVPSNLIRASLSVGWSGLSLEGSIARAIATDEPFYVWTAGVRLDTAYRGTLSLGIRMSYVKRTGSVTGTGGRFGGSLQIRIVRQFVLYAEAGVDVLDVPQNDDTVFSYAPFYGAGVRAVLGR